MMAYVFTSASSCFILHGSMNPRYEYNALLAVKPILQYKASETRDNLREGKVEGEEQSKKKRKNENDTMQLSLIEKCL